MLLNKAQIKVYHPVTINDLDKLAGSMQEQIVYCAGMTDLMIKYNQLKSANVLVNLNHCKDIINIKKSADGIYIGAATPLSDIINSQLVQKEIPILAEACRQIGSVQIQNRATIGGNLANASPAGDTLPVLLVLNAVIQTGPGKNGKYEELRVDELMLGPGKNSLKKNKYIARIFIPFVDQKKLFWSFKKVGQRHSMAISKLSLAVIGWKENDVMEKIRISAGSVTEHVVRAKKTERLLQKKKLSENVIDKAKITLMNEIRPISDIRSTENYRKKVCGELIREFLYHI